MNKYADLSSREKKFKSKNLFPCLSDARLRSPKLNTLRYRELSPYFDCEKSHFSGISKLALTQNMILNSFSDRLTVEDGSIRLPDISLKGVKEKDFKDLLEKLDEVISPKLCCTEVFIDEGVSHEFSVSADIIQTFKVPSKGKKCPISVKIRTICGIIQSFVSLTEVKKLPKSSYKSSKSHFHELFDLKSEFQADFVFITVKAISNSLFKIFSEFGKNKFVSNYKAYNGSIDEDSFTDSIDEAINKGKLIKKNFIRVNMAVKPMKNIETTSRAEIWKNKRDLIVKRKRLNEKAKKKKIVEIMNKRIERLEEVAMCQERTNQKQNLLKLSKLWLGIIYKTKSITSIYALIRIKRADFFKKIRTTQKVHLIQHFYKINLQPRTNSKVTANNTLLLFRNLTRIMHQKLTLNNTCSVISITAHNNLLFHMFASFFEKVILLQRAYRRFCKKKNFRMASLRIQWNRCIEKSMYTKKGSVRKRESLKFISIPSNVRDKVLKDFYYERWKELRVNIAAYSKVVGGVGAFISLPIFKYIPSDVIMEGIIRNVVTRPKVK